MSLKLTKVLVLDGVDSVCENILRKGGIEVSTRSKLSKEELVNELNNHDAVIVRSATKVTSDVLEASKRLKVVGRAGTGVDNIDVEAATKRGVLVMNTPGGNTLSAAEHTCSLICSLSRSIPQACATLKEGAWDRKKFMGNELNGKVLAIVGLGRIGKEVSDRMTSFGMRVIGYDPIVSRETAQSWGIEHMPLESLWTLADYITVHTPLIPQTRHLINSKVLSLCKPSVKIVNVARGGIVEEKALLEALNNGNCGGAALDVFEEEPPKDLTLVKHPKVICTPHLGANTYEAQKRVAEEIAEQLVAMSEGRQLTGVINAPALTDLSNPEARPWIELASALGFLASKLATSVKDIKLNICASGDCAKKFSRLLPASILKGFLRGKNPDVNLVNSPTLAKESNVEVTVVAKDRLENTALCLHQSIELVFQNGSLNCSLIGSTNGSKPVLYSLNGCLFTSGLTLNDNLVFFQTGKPAQALTTIVSSLQSSPLLAVLVSSPSSNETFVVARTPKSLEVIPSINESSSNFQITF